MMMSVFLLLGMLGLFAQGEQALNIMQLLIKFFDL